MSNEHNNAAPPRRLEALGQSEAFLAFQEALARVAPVERPVLLSGERGTGKELAAARLHFLSGRWQGPMATVNCAAIAPSLIEDELFGHEAGAFTGATRRRAGRFEVADGGTLFLDEIGAMPLEAQEKLLRVVEYGVFQRVGGSETVNVDVRIVGATNADLPALARDGRFKEDLLDRLSFEVLTLPPLRQRHGDVMLLANFFAARMAFELGRGEIAQFSEAATAMLEAHHWPGNVRQLKNVVERAVYRSDGPLIESVQLDPFVALARPAPAEAAPPSPAFAGPAIGGPVLGVPLPQQVRTLETALLDQALERAQYNQRRAAELLGVGYNQFRGLYRKYRPTTA